MHNDSPSQTPPPAGGTAADSGFFSWLRGLGVTREPGWLGGVAAGVALRLGIDALIVRGILVVIAILGGPVLFLYAAAWLLLPDASGRIHLQEMFRGVFDRALAGIGILVLLSMLPFGGNGWWWFGDWDAGWGAGPSLGAIIWTILLLGSGIWFVVWLANRDSTTGTTAPTAMPATGGTMAANAPTDTTAPAGAGEPSAPPAPPSDAADADLAAWRAGQDEWKREHDAWRAQQAATERAAHQQRLAEDRRKRQELAAERTRVAREHEARTRPSSAFTLVAVGLALLAGGAVALLLADPDRSVSTTVAASLVVTLTVLALAIIINGFRGRRSGGSSGVAVIVVISLLLTGVTGWFSGPVTAGRSLEWQPTAAERSELRTVIDGNVTLDLERYFAGDDSRVGTVDLFVISGDVDVIMPSDADGRVEVDVLSGSVRIDGDRVDDGAFASSVATYDAEAGEDRRLIVDVYVISGDVTVTQAD